MYSWGMGLYTAMHLCVPASTEKLQLKIDGEGVWEVIFSPDF